jgi:hypothetical protein
LHLLNNNLVAPQVVLALVLVLAPQRAQLLLA